MQVHDALDIADQMCEEGLTLSIGTIHFILYASEESHDFNLVCRLDSTCFVIVYTIYLSYWMQ